MPINWVDVADPHNPPAGAPKLSAANLTRLALVEDIGVVGTPTGDAGRAAFVGAAKLPTITVGKSRGVDFCTLDYASDDLALQAAVNSLPTGYGNGAAIRISPGAYDFVTGVTVPGGVHNLHLTGHGFATMLRWKNGNTFTNTAAGANWLLTLNDYTVVTDLQLQGLSTFGCPINGVNTFNPGAGANTLGGGILVTGGRTWINRVYITSMAEDGITNRGGIGTKYSDVEIIGCGGWGLNITNTANSGGSFATDSDQSSVWIGSCGNGVNVHEGGTWIAGAHIWGCQGDGILVDADCVRVSGCYIETNAGWGINVNGRTRNVVQGNDIWANGLSGGQKGGVQLSGTSHNNVVVGNQLRDNRYHAILATGSSSGNVIQGNVVTDSFGRQSGTPTAAISYTASGTLSSGSSTFTDANNPAWITSPNAVGTTLVVTGAGTSGATLTAQITAWANPSAGTYQVTLSSPVVTTAVNPVYSVHAVAYGVREAGTATQNVVTGNVVQRNDAQLGHVLLNAVTGANSVTLNNMGVDAQAWSELGFVSGGSLSVDLRNGSFIHGTLAANVTTVTFFPGASELNRGNEATVSLTQDGTAGRTVAGWPANVKFSTAGAPTFPATAAATGSIRFRYDGANWVEQSRSM